MSTGSIPFPSRSFRAFFELPVDFLAMAPDKIESMLPSFLFSHGGPHVGSELAAECLTQEGLNVAGLKKCSTIISIHFEHPSNIRWCLRPNRFWNRLATRNTLISLQDRNKCPRKQDWDWWFECWKKSAKSAEDERHGTNLNTFRNKRSSSHVLGNPVPVQRPWRRNKFDVLNLLAEHMEVWSSSQAIPISFVHLQSQERSYNKAKWQKCRHDQIKCHVYTSHMARMSQDQYKIHIL